MGLFGWLLFLGGLFGLVATRLGWYDRGGIIRRLDWFNLYETFGISARVRLANYIIFSGLVALGMLEILLSFLGLS